MPFVAGGLMNDYNRIAQVIQSLTESHAEQPNLADYAGLSQVDFHRLFSVWAGITPKDILPCLTLSNAKALLGEGNRYLDAALDFEPSEGPSQWQNLCLKLEAASPGQLTVAGEDWTITAGFADSPFGRCLIGECPRGICHLSFGEPAEDAVKWAWMVGNWPKAIFQRDDSFASRLVGIIFQHPNDVHRRQAYVKGTPFQIQVWRALLQIQPGTLVSYGSLATKIKNPKAARAVGTAVGQNPLAYVIPCHRVIRETGVIGNYGCGKVRKRVMLAWEMANFPRVNALV